METQNSQDATLLKVVTPEHGEQVMNLDDAISLLNSGVSGMGIYLNDVMLNKMING